MPDFRGHVRRNLGVQGLSGEREAEIVEEIALELQENYERALRSGLDPVEAWREVRDRARPWNELAAEIRESLGEPARAPEPTRSPSNRSLRFLEDFRRDLGFAARQLSKSPGFTAIAVLMLALGIGANTAIFSLLNAILLRSLPVEHPEQLVFFGDPQGSGSTTFFPSGNTWAFSYSSFREFRRSSQVFSNIAAIQSFLVTTHGRVAGGAEMEKLKVELVSGGYFETLGVNAILGRAFSESEDEGIGSHPVAVANGSWWRERFGKDTSLDGKTITIGSTVYTVIGVTPAGFHGMTVGQSPDVWIPLTMQKQICPDRYGLENDSYRSLHIFGRLKAGVSMQRAQAETGALFHRILTGYSGTQPSAQRLENIRRAWVELTPAASGRSSLRRQFRSPLKILMTVVILVLLIACANVANLLLARATSRQREMAVRMSVGAERPRLIRQLLAESGLLGFTGAALGIGFAWGASRLLLGMVSGDAAMLPVNVAPDAGVLAFTIAVTILTVFLFGTVPALRATRLDLASALKAGRGVASAPLRSRFARGLVVGQVALSLVLLCGAGLFLRSLANLLNTDVGFDKQNVVRLGVDPASAGYHTDARLVSIMQRIEQRLVSVPGVESASFALSVFDGGGSSSDDVRVPGRAPSDDDPHTDFNEVGPGYFEVMKTPVVLGRGLTLQDNAASRRIAVINQAMARTFFPGGSPIGRTFDVEHVLALRNIEVVGVVKDAKYMTLDEEQMPAAFMPYAQYQPEYLESLVIRYRGDPAVIVASVRRAVGEIDPNFPLGDVRMLSQMVDDFATNQRLVAQLSTFFGILAAALACIGIYGVMSYGIARRRNEFGIRMALGAGRGNVLWVVLRESLALAGAGVVAGLALELASSRLVSSMLYGVKPDNPLVIAAAVLAMIAVALLAAYFPARRATRIDPSSALRCE